MGENIILHDPEEEAEEALSLCDFPLEDETEKSPKQNRQSSTESSSPDHFFEFLSNLSSEMCPAEEIIFCGKLKPFKQHQQQQQQVLLPSTTTSTTTLSKEDKKHLAFRRRSESLSELQSSRTTRSSSTKTYKVLRNSRSLDYQKLHRLSSTKTGSPESEMDRNSSVRKSDKNKAATTTNKPRWYLLMFGIVKFPPEMDMRDIKNRQFRRNSSTMFPPLETSRNFPGNRSTTDKSSSWRFLKALSCKDHDSVTVTTSLCVPQHV